MAHPIWVRSPRIPWDSKVEVWDRIARGERDAEIYRRFQTTERTLDRMTIGLIRQELEYLPEILHSDLPGHVREYCHQKGWPRPQSNDAPAFPQAAGSPAAVTGREPPAPGGSWSRGMDDRVVDRDADLRAWITANFDKAVAAKKALMQHVRGQIQSTFNEVYFIEAPIRRYGDLEKEIIGGIEQCDPRLQKAFSDLAKARGRRRLAGAERAKTEISRLLDQWISL